MAEAAKRVKVHSGSEPPPPEVRDAYDEVYWEPPGADKLKYNKQTKTWDKATAQMRPSTMGEQKSAQSAAPAASPAPAGKAQPSSVQGLWDERARAKAEGDVQNATMQSDVAKRGELGGLGIADRGRVSVWLKQNPGKSADDAKKALGMTAGNQSKALAQ